MRKHILIIILFVTLTYGNCLLNNFVGDDNYTVTKNNLITSWNNLPLLFSKQYISTAEDIVLNSYHSKARRAGEVTYRPVVTFSYMVDYSFWKLHAFGYHFTNFLLHNLNAILAYIFVLLLAKDSLLAFFSGLLFGTHPFTSEAVNSISAREELLVVFFLLNAFILFIHFKRCGGLKRFAFYGASCLSFLLGMFSKETAIVFPALIILYDFLFEFNYDIKIALRNIRRYTGYLLTAIFYLIVYFFVFTPAVQPGLPYAGGSLYAQFLNIAVILARYISSFLIPLTIAIIPPFYYPLARAAFNYEVVVSILLLCLVAALAIRSYRYSKVVFFGLAWSFITILPVSNIFFRLVNMFSLRYMYFPIVGLCIALAFILIKFANLKSVKTVSPTADKVLMVFVVGSYMAVTVVQNIYWRSEFTFGQNQAMYYPYTAEPYQAMSKHYFERGYYEKSIKILKVSLKYKPMDSLSYNNMGVCYFELGMFDEAIKMFHNAVKIRPSFGEAHYNLGLAYLNKKELSKAAESFKKTIEIDPLYMEAYNNLAVAYAQLGRLEEAKEMFKKALELSPDNELAKTNLESLEKSLQEKN